MADESQKPSGTEAAGQPAAAAKAAEPPTPPIAAPDAEAGAPTTAAKAAGDKPASTTPAEPLKAEVSRTDAPGAGASAAPVAEPREEPPAPKPENPAAASTAVTSETSSATGQPTRPSQADRSPASAGQAAAAKPPVAKPAPAAAKAASTAGAAAVPKAAAHPPPAAAPPSGPTEPPPPAGMAVPAFITTLQSAVADSVSLVSYYVGDWTIVVPLDKMTAALRHLRDAPDAAFDFCSDVTASDWPPRKEARFDLVYCLYSTHLRHRIRVKVRAGESTPVPSVTDIWPAANWLEREVYDMFGVNFTGHPDRRRILMPDDWQGFPQRKDYPLEGPGELLMENPEDWLKLRQARDEADIE
jgi:NADH-quinone oxidoreductase subunit C